MRSTLCSGGTGGCRPSALIQRLCRAAGCHPRRVGLSATIGEPEAAGKFLAAGSGRPTVIPACEGGKEVWRLSMEHFFSTPPPGGPGEGGPASLPAGGGPPQTRPPPPRTGAGIYLPAHQGEEVPYLHKLPGGVRGRCARACASTAKQTTSRTGSSSTTGICPPLTGERRGGDEGRRLPAVRVRHRHPGAGASTSAGWSGRSRSTPPLPCPGSSSAWAAPAGGGTPLRCGSSCGRTTPSPGPCCRTDPLVPDPGQSPWCSCIWRSALWSLPAPGGCPSACCTTRP